MCIYIYIHISYNVVTYYYVVFLSRQAIQRGRAQRAEAKAKAKAKAQAKALPTEEAGM